MVRSNSGRSVVIYYSLTTRSHFHLRFSLPWPNTYFAPNALNKTGGFHLPGEYLDPENLCILFSKSSTSNIHDPYSSSARLIVIVMPALLWPPWNLRDNSVVSRDSRVSGSRPSASVSSSACSISNCSKRLPSLSHSFPYSVLEHTKLNLSLRNVPKLNLMSNLARWGMLYNTSELPLAITLRCWWFFIRILISGAR